MFSFFFFFVSLRANNWYKNRLVDHTIRKAIKIIDEGLINRKLYRRDSFLVHFLNKKMMLTDCQLSCDESCVKDFNRKKKQT